MKIPTILLVSLLLFVSCTTDDVCDENNQSEMVVRFKTVFSDIIKDTILSGVTIYGIRDGISDSLLYDSGTASRILLPMDSHHDFSKFAFNINNQTDTLKITHITEFNLTSYACGFAAIFTIDTVYYSTPMIKKYEIINAVIDTELEQDEEHLWIYF